MNATPLERDSVPRGQQPDTQRQMALLSHDLRSALAGITGGLRLLDSERLTPQDRTQLDRVIRESNILADLMDIAMNPDDAATGAAVSPEGSCDLAQFLRQQSAKWKAQADEKAISWHLQVKGQLPDRINVSALRLTRAIGNVVNNAIKYTDSGAVEVAAEVDPFGALTLTITDNGPGFSAAALAKAFDYLGRPEDSAKPGTGMGLHISKTLLDQIGASISIQNRQGVGAQAEISFPSALFSSFDAAAAAPARAPLPDLTGIRILLAEDNKTNQMVATQMLQTMHAEVTVASDGYEALQKYEKGTFDLALLDIEMPRMSGLDVLRAIRARTDERANTPLVALTAYAMREHKERITAAGANGLIPKPLISIESFGQALLDYLNIDRKTVVGPAPEVAPLPQAVAGETIDLHIYDALQAAMGTESMAELLEKVAEDISSVKSGLLAGAAQGNFQLVRSNTHILISVAGAIGAVNLQSLAERLNAAAHGGNEEAIAELSQQCISVIATVETFLGRERERYRRNK